LFGHQYRLPGIVVTRLMCSSHTLHASMTRVVSIIVAADNTQLSGPFTLFLQGATESCLLQDSKRKRTRLNPSRDTRSVCCSEPTRVLSKDRNVHERNPRPQICKRPCSQFNLSPIFNIPFFQKYNFDVIRPAYELRVINHWFRKNKLWCDENCIFSTWHEEASQNHLVLTIDSLGKCKNGVTNWFDLE